MNVSRQEFDAHKIEVTSAIENLHLELKSGYESIMTFMINLQAHIDEKFEQIDEKFKRIDEKFDRIDEKFKRIDEKFEQVDENFKRIDEKFKRIDEKFDRVDERLNTIEAKIDRLELQLNNVINDASHFRSNVGARFGIVSDQLRILDQELFRSTERYSNLEKRVINAN